MRLKAGQIVLLLLVLLGCVPLLQPNREMLNFTPTPLSLTGEILIDGSSTVAPITQAVADEFMSLHPHVTVTVKISGTGGGFKKFCNGVTDVSNASRPIDAKEMEVCQQNGVTFIELPVAFDGLSVVVNPTNDWAICLTTEELKRIWEPAAEGKITSWRHIRPTFPDRPLSLYGAGLDSGTYDYFTQAIVGTEGMSRLDFFGSENDMKLVEGVASDPNALGFFGYAYYDQNRHRLKLLSIDNGIGCVEPNTETVARGLYQPLSRPLFIYVNSERMRTNSALEQFVAFYLERAAFVSLNVGYIPLTDQLYALVERRFQARTEGSLFHGEGAEVGVSVLDLLVKENTSR